MSGRPTCAGRLRRFGRNRLKGASLLVLACLVPVVAAAEPAAAQTPAKFIYVEKQPAPSLAGGAEWINTLGPLELRELRGKFVLLDFWTYCCINCMHILPELKKLEHAYLKHLVVIGVHSGKFHNEHDAQNIREAVLRYEIEHPVVSDPNYLLWNRFGIDTWPSLVLIDPEGNLIGGLEGEAEFEELNGVLKKLLPSYRRKGVLDETPLEFNIERHLARPTALAFPGKVLADGAGNRLFIADSNHNRIVVCRLDGELVETIGMGAIGRQDGGYAEATFDHPQGMALQGDTLYVADTENHLLRKIDLRAQRVETIAGVGRQRRDRYANVRSDLGKPNKTALNSPWALVIQGEYLYIAMAGAHQIWKMALDESRIGVHAGNATEDITDGPLLPRNSRQKGTASFAQPSGLATDGKWLFVADSEGSSIRAVPFELSGSVRTVVGTSHLPTNRLFTFGDVDGQQPLALLQHPLDVVYYGGLLYVADTYNSKIKAIEVEQQSVTTLAGNGVDRSPGDFGEPDDALGVFDEPAGLSAADGKLYVADTNNHRIRVIDLRQANRVSTLSIAGLEPPAPTEAESKPLVPGAKYVRVSPMEVQPSGGRLKLAIALRLPPGHKLNQLAPLQYWIEAAAPQELLDRAALDKPLKLTAFEPEFEISVPLAAAEGADTLKVGLTFYYCHASGSGLCKAASVVWTVPVTLSPMSRTDTIELKHRIE